MISALVPSMSITRFFCFLGAIEKGCSFETAVWLSWFSSISRKKNFYPPNKTTTCWVLFYTEQGTSKSTWLPIANPDQASLVTTWRVSLLKLLAMAVRCVKTRWHHNAAPKPMQSSMKNMALFPYQINCLCWKIALLDIALCLTLRGWPPWCSKLCWLTFCVPSENSETLWWFGSTMLRLWRQLCWLFDLWSELNQEPLSCGGK